MFWISKDLGDQNLIFWILKPMCCVFARIFMFGFAVFFFGQDVWYLNSFDYVVWQVLVQVNRVWIGCIEFM